MLLFNKNLVTIVLEYSVFFKRHCKCLSNWCLCLSKWCLFYWLCLVSKFIGCVYHISSANLIVNSFQKWYWKQLKNIMYKEKKFIMEIIDNNNQHPHLKHVNSSPGLIMDHAGMKKPQPSVCSGEAVFTDTWYSTPKVVLALWRMAKVQHKFSKAKSTSVRKIYVHSNYGIAHNVQYMTCRANPT